MDGRVVTSRAGGAVRLSAALGALATPPLLLAATVGNPLPALPIDWVRVVASAQAGLVPSAVWVNVLAAAAWVAWAVLVGMLAIEVVAVARNRPSPARLPVWVRHLAQLLVAAAIALAGPGPQALAFAAATAPITVTAAPDPVLERGSALETQGDAQGSMVTVGEGDSWGGFAAELLGDASLGAEVRAANLGRTVGDGHTISASTAFVEPGWQLLIPAHLHTATVSAVDSATWDVERGDHFWGIAEAALAESWGRAPTDAEIDPYWRQLVEANRDGLLPPGDPNLIYPSQQLTVPSPPPDPALSDHAPQAASDAVEDPEEPAAASEEAAAPAEPTTPHEESAAAPEEADVPDDPAPTPAAVDGWRAALEGQASDDLDDRPPADAEVAARSALGVSAGLTAGVAASTLLAAGILAAVRWRRRTRLQQRAPGMRLPTPLPTTDAEVAKLDAAAAPEETLNDLAALLASVPLDVHRCWSGRATRGR